MWWIRRRNRRGRESHCGTARSSPDIQRRLLVRIIYRNMSRRKNEIRWSRRFEYIRIYESIVIEFFHPLKLHKIVVYVPKFHIENLKLSVSQGESTKFNRLVDMMYEGHIQIYESVVPEFILRLKCTKQLYL